MSSPIQNQVRFWQQSSARSWRTALDLYKTKHFDICLFFCHLTIEKYLKARVVEKTKEAAPYSHDLVMLAGVAGVELRPRDEELCRILTTFNISGRYDDYKFQFYKKATSAYARKYLRATEELYLWLQKKYSL